MATPIAVASSVLAVVLVIVLAREIRLRRALECLLKKLLTYWRTHTHMPAHLMPIVLLTLVIVGCTSSDDRLVEMAREIRLRRALECLLKKLLTYWRTHAHTRAPDADRPADAGDRRLHK